MDSKAQTEVKPTHPTVNHRPTAWGPTCQPPSQRSVGEAVGVGRPNPWFGRTANSTASPWPPRVDSNRPCNDGCAGPEPIHSSEPTCTRYKRRASFHFQIITYQEEEEEAPHSKAKLCFSYS